ncbi:hypothetical protein C8A00DRAFT_44744 [Chaetomidium leptoderma]|uniref:Zn(2)-C6 fungal-type domain-containing protein n=1 Tax=Chaetomidium leptoderma TaxID=669021 RepID=A0AAN6ZU97_9PEZI|nr:hypothetical protein C8A00DRAFT_44744 [Chaetomidium leptoderma]
MDSPRSESSAAVLVGDGGRDTVVDSFWDPAYSAFSLDSLFTPETNHPGPANTVANPNANVAINSPTCASQAVRAPSHVRAAGIDPTAPNLFPDADQVWPAPAAAAPVQAGLADLARLFAAGVSSRPPGRPRRESLSTQLPSAWDGGGYPTGPFGAQMLGGPVDLGPLLALDLPVASFSPVPPLAAALNQWTPAANPGPNPTSSSDQTFTFSPRDLSTTFNTTFDTPKPITSDGGVGPNSNECGTSSWPTPHYPSSPNSHMSDEAVSCDHGRRASTVYRAPSATVPKSLPPEKRRRTSQPPTPPAPLAIVQYMPGSGEGTTLSRKRPAFEEVIPQGMASQTLRQVLVHDDHGEVTGTMFTFGNRVKTRAVFSEEKRQQTAQARREGVCPRCKRSKRQCDLAQKQSLYVSCTLCAGTKIYKNAPRHPCFKATLADILFFRSRPAANEPFFTKRHTVFDLKDLSKPDVPVIMLKLTQHVGPHQLTVYASEFVPFPDDVVSYKWHDGSGTSHELKMPPFCLTNMERVQRHIRQYIGLAKWSYIRSLEKEDELAWMTVSMAAKHAQANPDSLVADALSLWAISRMIEIPWQMCGPDTLGVSPVGNTTSPHYQRIPIPPMMDTQLDQIVIQFILTPLRDRLIQKFERLISPAKPEAWWEVYLSAFILLNHIERLARHSVAHARTHTMPGKYSNIDFLEGVFHTAKSILARFHFICNGSAPLRLDWTSPKVAAMAKLNGDQVKFMQRTQAMIAARENDVLRLRAAHKYERPLYWAGQLFTEDFDTSPVHVVEELDEEEVKAAVAVAVENEP